MDRSSKICMRRNLWLIILLLSLGEMYADERNLFNDAWRFHRGDALGAMQSHFIDSHWHMVDLPHDWRLTPDSLNSIPTEADTVGWYRKTFTIQDSDTARNVYLYFERIHGKADIWINDTLIHSTSCSYEPVRIDVTPYLRAPWKSNTIAIRVGATPWSDADYRGAGITHDTWLTKTNRIHFDDWDTQVQTTRVYRKRGNWLADLNLSAIIRNATTVTDGEIEVVITTPDRKEAFKALYPVQLMDSTTFTTNISLKEPQNWSYDIPAMYKAHIRLRVAGEISDTLQIPFGIRSVTYDPYMGLLCNDDTPLLQGATLDYNGRLTGYTSFRRAEALFVEHMQYYGYSAVRCPMGLLSEHFLNACDTLGVMVLVDAFSPIHRDDEWSEQATTDNIRRFRNHPSIIMWCINDTIREKPTIEAVDNSRPIGASDLLRNLRSEERNALGEKTLTNCSLDAERRVKSVTMGVSAPDTTRTDTIVWLPEVQRWTWPGYEGKMMRVNIYSRSDWVHLHLNDKLVGSARLRKRDHQKTFYVPYVPGKISASTLYNDRNLWTPKIPRTKILYIGFPDVFSLKTTVSEPKRIQLSADCTETTLDNGEICFVKIEVQDGDGNLIPDAEIPLSLHIRGPGTIAAAGNSKGISPSLHTLSTYQGSAMVVIRPSDETQGLIRLTVYPPEGIKIEDTTIFVY